MSGVAPAEIALRRLPRGGLELSELSLGCSQLGNLYREVSDEQARDTSTPPGRSASATSTRRRTTALGLSERRLGLALAAPSACDYVLSTKVGRLLEPLARRGLDDEGFAVPAATERVWDFSRDGIRRSLSESLERLGLDRVDIVYLHDPENHMDEVFESGYPALEELRSEGLVRAIGAGMNFTAPLADLVRHTDVDLVMLAGRYTLLEQDALDELLPAVRGTRRRRGRSRGLQQRPAGAAAAPEDAKYNYGAAPAELVERARANRRRVRAPRNDAAGRGDRLPARPSGGGQRLRRRSLARAADRAQ